MGAEEKRENAKEKEMEEKREKAEKMGGRENKEWEGVEGCKKEGRRRK